MQTLSAEQFKQKYGQAGAQAFNTTPAQPKQPGYIKNVTDLVGTDLANRAQRFQSIQESNRNPILKAGQMFGQGAGAAANALETTVTQLPGVKQAVQGVGSGLHWLATSPYSVVKGLGDIIGQSKMLQEITHLYDTDQSFKDTVDAVGNTVRLGGDIQTIVDSANFTANVTKKVINNVKGTVDSMAQSTALEDATKGILGKGKGVVSDVIAPDKIMNRVARLNPTDETKFVKMTGKTPGEYLTETGNFGAPDKIIANESTKFVKSMQSVDDELAKLPGVYKDGSVTDALKGLVEKVKNVSSDNVPAGYASQVDDLVKKYNAGGLSMEDINAVKRLYERNVKLGYNKLMNADKVEQATNIDSALRQWQVKQASDLGFTNIADLNKQTQISKFIVNKLGAKVLGQMGNNSMTLTDWIMLSGGNSQAVAGFLTKKFFSSNAVQAKIAELLNTGEIKGQIMPETTMTAENIKRQVSPQGLKQLSAPEAGVTQSGIDVPINQPPRKAIDMGTEVVPKTSKQSTPLSTEKVSGKTSLDTTTVPKDLQPLAQEARKYKSAEEFVKAQPKVYRGEGGSNVAQGKALLAEGKHFASDAEYPKGFGKVGEYVLKPNAKVLDLGDSTFIEISQKLGIPERRYISPKELSAIAKEKGYDVVKYAGEYKSTGKQFSHTVDLTGDSYITKSQLTDIWKKANKK